MLINDYSAISKQYASSDNSGTAFLAFKHIETLIKKFSHGIKTLDYGCGSGNSSIFLKEIGLDVNGVDISSDMLNEAKIIKNINFSLIESGVLPYDDNSYDIVFSSFVLFEISTKNELTKIFNEIYRILKNNGIFIAVTGSEEMYTHNWLSLDANYQENLNLKSGDIAKILIKEVDLIVYDYFWTDKDYNDVISNTKFNILKSLFPLGEDHDGYPWIDEVKHPPYVVYVMSKTI